MIDLKTLAKWHEYDADYQGGGYGEILRLAMRYLALRDAAKTKEGRIKVQAIFWNMGSRKDVDAAADRMIQERIGEMLK